MNKQRYIISNPEIRKRAAQAVLSIRGEDNMEVIIQPHKHDKTAEQRGWFHALCKLLGDELGYTLGEIKELVKMEVLGAKVIVIGGIVREVAESSEKQDRKTYSQLIDGVYRIAAEAGVVLPPPMWRGNE